jgi:vacuolar iron transporter family protein
MGLGGYLAARSDAEHFETEAKREQLEIIQQTQAEEQEI